MLFIFYNVIVQHTQQYPVKTISLIYAFYIFRYDRNTVLFQNILNAVQYSHH